MFEYPNKLNIIFDKLNKNMIKSIIIGGYVRDKMLNLNSKDIDIEVYGVNSLLELEKILKEFGEVNSVGKSFGVCKLRFHELDIDFSLPREDSKISSGHRGFLVTTNSKLDFITASSRRDFSMNAIGYDVIEKKLLDPFHGIKDIKNKTIKAVDLSKFDEDPLRVLRAVQFAARFEFTLDNALLNKCKKMVKEKLLDELPKERLFEEIKKLLLKSNKPSLGILLLKELQSTLYFDEFEEILDALDYLAKQNIEDSNIKLTLMLALLSYKFQEDQNSNLLNLLTEKKELHKNISSLLKSKNTFNIQQFSDYDLYKLATYVNIENFLCLLNAVTLGKESEQIQLIVSKAKKLKILHTQAKALIHGKDLIKLGYKPSTKFSTLLAKAYDAQMHSQFINYNEALQWIKIHLKI